MEKKVKSFAIAALRRSSFRWPPRYLAVKDSKVSRGLYTCNKCKQLVRAKDKELDHVIPVVDTIKGWTNFDDFIERLYCEKEGFQTLCQTCHYEKSKLEGTVRTKSRLTRKKKTVKVSK